MSLIPSSMNTMNINQNESGVTPQVTHVAYAPMVWRDNPWWQYARMAAKEGLIIEDGRIVDVLPDLIDRELSLPYAQDGIRAARAEGADDSIALSLMVIAMSFRHWVPMIGQYELQGRQIFQLSDGLLEMLQNTTHGDCTLADLHLPYHAQYIHLGLQESMSAPYDATENLVLTHEFVTGAFVATAQYDMPGEMQGNRIKFGLTTATALGRVNEAPTHYFDVLPSEAQLPVEQAIDAAMKRRIGSLRKALNVDEKLKESWFEGFVEDTANLIKKAMPMIMNTLFYMESMREEAKLALGNGTPDSLRAKWTASAGTGKRHKIESALFKEGHTVVKILGADIPTSAEVLGSSGSDGARRAHWRQGHFRQQACGPQMSIRKRILIKPVLVNAHGLDPMDVDGHIYKVGPEIDQSRPKGPRP